MDLAWLFISSGAKSGGTALAVAKLIHAQDRLPFDDRDFLQDDLSNALTLGNEHADRAMRILGNDADFSVIRGIHRAGRIGYTQLRL